MSELIGTIGDGLGNAFQMAWEVWWALILGFMLSGIVQAWVTRGQIERVKRPVTATQGCLSFSGRRAARGG